MDVKLVYFCLLVVLIAAPLSGCGEKPQASKQPDNVAAPDSTRALPAESKMMVGTWYGQARLNQELLNRKLEATVDTTQRNALEAMAQTFQSTEIGAVFSSDGTMQLDIQIQPPGQPALRDSTQGTWKPVEILSNAIVLETTETLASGAVESSQVRYEFRMDGQIAIMSAPTAIELAQFNPVIVFRRVEQTAASVTDGATHRLIH